MITDKVAQNILLKMANNRQFSFDKWTDQKFVIFKLASTTEKGDIGEDFLANILKICGCNNVDVVKGRRGPYDVSVKHNKKDVLFEVKVATRDIHNAFQFNGIRYDTQYTHLFCLGVSPNKISYLIIKKELVGTGKYKMVSMAKGSNASFKLTKKETLLNSFDKFDTDIRDIFK